MFFKKLFIMAISFLACTGMNAQTVIQLYNKEIPNSKPIADKEKWVDRPGGDKWVSDVTIPTLTYFPSVNKKEKSPAVVICPGGGYAGLSIVKEGFRVAEEFSKHGINAFVLKYRLPDSQTMKDRSIGPLQDAQQAFLLIKENADKWNVDVNKIGIMGFSAGGHLAALASNQYAHPQINTHGVSVRPDFSILIYPVISMEDTLTHQGSKDNLLGKEARKEWVHWASNEQNVGPQTPSAFLVHAQDDGAVNVKNSLYYYEALTRHKVPSQLLIYPKGGHGFGMNNSTTKDLWINHVFQWLDDYILKTK